jgi:hypothetical protein
MKCEKILTFDKVTEDKFTLEQVEFNPSLPYFMCKDMLFNQQLQRLKIPIYLYGAYFSATGKYIIYDNNSILPLPETFLEILENDETLVLDKEIKKEYGI